MAGEKRIREWRGRVEWGPLPPIALKTACTAVQRQHSVLGEGGGGDGGLDT